MIKAREFCYVLRDANGDYLKVSSKPFAGATEMTDADYVVQSEAHNASKVVDVAALESKIIQGWDASAQTRLDELIFSDRLAKLHGVKDDSATVKALMVKK